MAVSQLPDQLYRARTKYTKAAAATLTEAECKCTRIKVTGAGATITLPTCAAKYEDADIEVLAANDTSAVVILAGNTANDHELTVGPHEFGRVISDGVYWYTVQAAAQA